MSWNFGTRLNNLQIQVNNLAQTSLTNPLTAPLGCASYPINDATQLSATAGQNLNVNVSAGQNITLNGPVNIPNHPLTITNNTNNDSLIVTDQPGDTNVFRIDAFGNVGILQSPSITLPTGLSVNGPITCGNILSSNVVNSITAGNPSIQMGGTQNNRLVSLAPTIQVDVAQSNNNNAEINYNTPSTPGWNNNSLIIKAKNQTSNYTAIFNTATGSTNLPQVNTDTIASITGGEINVNNNLDLGANSLTCGTLNYTTLNPPITDAGITQIIPEVGITATVAGNQAYIGNTGVISVTAGANVSVDNTDPKYPVISATAGGSGTLTNITSTNLGITIANPTTTPALTPKYIGNITFQFDSATVATGSVVSPGNSLTLWYLPLTPLATSILTQYAAPAANLALQIKFNPCIYIQGFANGGANSDNITFDIVTDAGGSAPGADNNRFWNNIQDFPITCNFTMTTQTNGFSNSSNTKVGLVIGNGCTTGGAGIFMATIPNIISFDVIDQSNFS